MMFRQMREAHALVFSQEYERMDDQGHRKPRVIVKRDPPSVSGKVDQTVNLPGSSRISKNEYSEFKEQEFLEQEKKIVSMSVSELRVEIAGLKQRVRQLNKFLDQKKEHDQILVDRFPEKSKNVAEQIEIDERERAIRKLNQKSDDLSKEYAFYKQLFNRKFLDEFQHDIIELEQQIQTSEDECRQRQNLIQETRDRVSKFQLSHKYKLVKDQKEVIARLNKEISSKAEERDRLNQEMLLISEDIAGIKGSEEKEVNEVKRLEKLLVLKERKYAEATERLNKQLMKTAAEIEHIKKQEEDKRKAAIKKKRVEQERRRIIEQKRLDDERFIQEYKEEKQRIREEMKRKMKMMKEENAINRRISPIEALEPCPERTIIMILPTGCIRRVEAIKFLAKAGEIEGLTVSYTDGCSVVCQYRTNLYAATALEKLNGRSFKGTKVNIVRIQTPGNEDVEANIITDSNKTRTYDSLNSHLNISMKPQTSNSIPTDSSQLCFSPQQSQDINSQKFPESLSHNTNMSPKKIIDASQIMESSKSRYLVPEKTIISPSNNVNSIEQMSTDACDHKYVEQSTMSGENNGNTHLQECLDMNVQGNNSRQIDSSLLAGGKVLSGAKRTELDSCDEANNLNLCSSLSNNFQQSSLDARPSVSTEKYDGSTKSALEPYDDQKLSKNAEKRHLTDEESLQSVKDEEQSEVSNSGAAMSKSDTNSAKQSIIESFNDKPIDKHSADFVPINSVTGEEPIEKEVNTASSGVSINKGPLMDEFDTESDQENKDNKSSNDEIGGGVDKEFRDNSFEEESNQERKDNEPNEDKLNMESNSDGIDKEVGDGKLDEKKKLETDNDVLNECRSDRESCNNGIDKGSNRDDFDGGFDNDNSDKESSKNILNKEPNEGDFVRGLNENEFNKESDVDMLGEKSNNVENNIETDEYVSKEESNYAKNDTETNRDSFEEKTNHVENDDNVLSKNHRDTCTYETEQDNRISNSDILPKLDGNGPVDEPCKEKSTHEEPNDMNLDTKLYMSRNSSNDDIKMSALSVDTIDQTSNSKRYVSKRSSIKSFAKSEIGTVDGSVALDGNTMLSDIISVSLKKIDSTTGEVSGLEAYSEILLTEKGLEDENDGEKLNSFNNDFSDNSDDGVELGNKIGRMKKNDDELSYKGKKASCVELETHISSDKESNINELKSQLSVCESVLLPVDEKKSDDNTLVSSRSKSSGSNHEFRTLVFAPQTKENCGDEIHSQSYEQTVNEQEVPTSRLNISDLDTTKVVSTVKNSSNTTNAEPIKDSVDDLDDLREKHGEVNTETCENQNNKGICTEYCTINHSMTQNDERTEINLTNDSIIQEEDDIKLRSENKICNSDEVCVDTKLLKNDDNSPRVSTKSRNSGSALLSPSDKKYTKEDIADAIDNYFNQLAGTLELNEKLSLADRVNDISSDDEETLSQFEPKLIAVQRSVPKETRINPPTKAPGIDSQHVSRISSGTNDDPKVKVSIDVEYVVDPFDVEKESASAQSEPSKSFKPLSDIMVDIRKEITDKSKLDSVRGDASVDIEESNRNSVSSISSLGEKFPNEQSKLFLSLDQTYDIKVNEKEGETTQSVINRIYDQKNEEIELNDEDGKKGYTLKSQMEDLESLPDQNRESNNLGKHDVEYDYSIDGSMIKTKSYLVEGEKGENPVNSKNVIIDVETHDYSAEKLNISNKTEDICECNDHKDIEKASNSCDN